MLPRMTGRLILSILLSMCTAGLLCPAQESAAHAPVRYHFGDDPEGRQGWANPNFDDSAWPIAENGRWPMPPFYSNGFVWIRFQTPVRSDIPGPLAVRISRDFFARGLSISFADEVYVNGALTGRLGGIPPQTRLETPQQDAVFDLPPGSAMKGEKSLVAIRVWCPPYLRTPAFSGAFKVDIDESRNLLLVRRASHFADLYTNGLDLALDIGIGILGIGMVFAWRWTGERDLLVFAWVMIPQAILLLIWNPTVAPVASHPFQFGLATFLAALTLFMVALVELNWTVHHLRAPLLKRLAQAAAVVFTMAILIPGLFMAPVPFASLAALATFPSDVFFESLLVAVNIWAIVTRRTNLLLALALLGNPLIALLNDSGIVPYSVMVGPFNEHSIALADFVIDCAIFILLSRGAWKAWRARDELRVEFEAAREVQEQLVAPAHDVPGFQIESVYAPAKQVGGDFFRVLPDPDGSVLVVVGDVSGKGLKAAMTVSAIMGALRGSPSRKPAEILVYLNRVLFGQVSGFVTCCAALIAPDGAMTIANAGNPAPYRDGKEMAVDPSLPLGLIAEADYAETRCQIDPGDKLTFVSDGVVEATSPTGELFGFERSAAISRESAEKIARTAQAFGQEDDITVLSVTRAGGAQPT